MELTIQTALLNVSDLQRSLAFYQEVFDLHVVSQRDGVAALMISEAHRRQVLVLRDLMGNAHHGGSNEVGVRMLALEAASSEELDEIEKRLKDRDAFLGDKQSDNWRAVIGFDPDRVTVSVASSLTGSPISTEHWQILDDFVYSIAR
jgi:catechol 2,3-dioxygenase-like lactoylglutathione lyase family enzyme